MNKLADEKLLDETVVYYMSDHGLTLGENGDHGQARRPRPVAHLPRARDDPAPRGQAAPGETSDYFASTHDVAPTLLSFMGVRAPGMMDGEDLSVLFDGSEPPSERPLLHLLLRRLRPGRRPRLVPHLGQRGPAQAPLRQEAPTRARCTTWRPSIPEIVDRLWKVLEDEAGGTLPQFGPSGAKAGDRRVRLTRRGLLGAAGPPPQARGVLGALAAAGRPRRAAAAGSRAARRPAGGAAAGARRLRGCLRGRRGGGHAEPRRPDRGLAALRPRDPRVACRRCRCGARS